METSDYEPGALSRQPSPALLCTAITEGCSRRIKRHSLLKNRNDLYLSYSKLSARFHDVRIHPRWRKFPLEVTSQDDFLLPGRGPGHYEMIGDFSPQVIEKKIKGPGWKEAKETEVFSALPQVRFKESKWKARKEAEWNLGPTTYHIKDFHDLLKEKPSSHIGVCGTLEHPRFKDKILATPGIGHYGKGGVPSAAMETLYNTPVTEIGIMDYNSGKCRSSPSVGGRLGPGTYEFKDGIDVFLQKIVSLKGPYSLFTGKRDETSLYGKQTTPWRANLGPGQYEYKSFVDDLMKKTDVGKFRTSARFAPMQKSPGPTDYSPRLPARPQAKQWPPFNTSAVRKSIFEANTNMAGFPGPSRYDYDKRYNIPRFGNTSSFKNEGKFLPKDREKVLKFRLQPKNVPLWERPLYEADFMYK